MRVVLGARCVGSVESDDLMTADVFPLGNVAGDFHGPFTPLGDEIVGCVVSGFFGGIGTVGYQANRLDDHKFQRRLVDLGALASAIGKGGDDGSVVTLGPRVGPCEPQLTSGPYGDRLIGISGAIVADDVLRFVSSGQHIGIFGVGGNSPPNSRVSVLFISPRVVALVSVPRSALKKFGKISDAYDLPSAWTSVTTPWPRTVEVNAVAIRRRLVIDAILESG